LEFCYTKETHCSLWAVGFLFQANHVYPYKTLFLLARLPMIAITISSSMSVKPDEFL